MGATDDAVGLTGCPHEPEEDDPFPVVDLEGFAAAAAGLLARGAGKPFAGPAVEEEVATLMLVVVRTEVGADVVADVTVAVRATDA